MAATPVQANGVSPPQSPADPVDEPPAYGPTRETRRGENAHAEYDTTSPSRDAAAAAASAQVASTQEDPNPTPSSTSPEVVPPDGGYVTDFSAYQSA